MIKRIKDIDVFKILLWFIVIAILLTLGFRVGSFRKNPIITEESVYPIETGENAYLYSRYSGISDYKTIYYPDANLYLFRYSPVRLGKRDRAEYLKEIEKHGSGFARIIIPNIDLPNGFQGDLESRFPEAVFVKISYPPDMRRTLRESLAIPEEKLDYLLLKSGSGNRSLPENLERSKEHGLISEETQVNAFSYIVSYMLLQDAEMLSLIQLEWVRIVEEEFFRKVRQAASETDGPVLAVLNNYSFLRLQKYFEQFGAGESDGPEALVPVFSTYRELECSNMELVLRPGSGNLPEALPRIMVIPNGSRILDYDFLGLTRIWSGWREFFRPTAVSRYSNAVTVDLKPYEAYGDIAVLIRGGRSDGGDSYFFYRKSLGRTEGHCP